MICMSCFRVSLQEYSPDSLAVIRFMPLDNSQTEILIVDDTVENIKLLTQLLSSEGYKVKGAASGNAALRICKKNQPDLILLDIMMPGMDGYEVCSELKSDPSTKDIPIIFLSALDNVQDKVRAFQVGGVDYIEKPFETMEVIARVKNHTQIVSLQRKLIARNKELKKLAETDALTGLLNRRKMGELAESQMSSYFVVLFDIDNFKQVNDKYGHHTGDKVLVDIAELTQNILKDKGHVSRWGGEEFLILLPLWSRADAKDFANSLMQALRASEDSGVTASFGVAEGSSAISFTDVVKEADSAMYTAKVNGKNQIVVSRL